jgi:hypothetical protein
MRRLQDPAAVKSEAESAAGDGEIGKRICFVV